MDRMLSTVAKLAQNGGRNDDDIIDRLHHRYTVLLLVVFTVIISTTQYVGTPIHCWCPAEFTDSHQRYTERICWISDTYYLPESAVAGNPDAKKRHISYYQWVPMTLLIQAAMFRLPCLFWRLFSDRSGININNLVEAAETIQNALYPERREKTIRYMIRHLDHYLNYQRDYRGGACDSCQQCIAHGRSRLTRCCFACGNRRGNYLVVLYAITKFLYLFNVVGQFFLLDRFLGGNYHFYGIRVISDLVRGGWRAAIASDMAAFPRVTLCDFQVRRMGNLHAHTVQCVLPINFFSEKIYLALWLWLAVLGAVTALSVLSWAWVLLPARGRRRYVRQNLKIMARLRSTSDATSNGSGSNMERDRDRTISRRFAEVYLRQDGVFVLKLVAKNSTDLVVADIMAALWDNFRSKSPLLGNFVDRCSDDGDEQNGIVDGRACRQSPVLGYIGDIGDISLDPVDIV